MLARDRSARIGLGGRAGWNALVAGMAGLGVLEAAILHFAGTALLPSMAAHLLDLVVGVLTLAFLLAAASPLWTRIRIDDTTIHARFGWLGSLDIARAEVSAVGPHRATPQRPAQLGMDFDAESGLLSWVRSPTSPLVRIDFDVSLPARTQGWKRIEARSLLLSVDDADHALAALHGSPR
ncbi:hypothetical protein LTV02_11665 [Nocardia yamanashiensis]|uniref:hypothetical protein n=1 Tax=Nocardia yamanashiensis TaxID=209247 RepID=UPI001E5533CC|nr:hypothetical protein [Nocardia yamanashiensis]UGT43993.1 hypothetical protein LTV02_11665 [Nocardia yamanashiensis]